MIKKQWIACIFYFLSITFVTKWFVDFSYTSYIANYGYLISYGSCYSLLSTLYGLVLIEQDDDQDDK